MSKGLSSKIVSSVSFLDALTLKIIPKPKQVIQIEVPPLLINGKVCPVTGKIFTATAMLISALKTIGIPTPITSNVAKIVFAFFAVINSPKTQRLSSKYCKRLIFAQKKITK